MPSERKSRSYSDSELLWASLNAEVGAEALVARNDEENWIGLESGDEDAV